MSKQLACLVIGVSTLSQAVGQDLPKAEDVLPAGEVSKGSLVVVGEGYRFQVPPGFKRVDHPSNKSAYRGTVEGLIGKTEVTLYATKEAFTGDLAALIKRETDAVTEMKGKVSMSMPVKLHIAGQLSDAHRFLVRVNEKLELRVLAVDKGQAYIFHAETPNKNNAWANVGSDLAIRGATFHVSPPAKGK
jgi:hypothetical protein